MVGFWYSYSALPSHSSSLSSTPILLFLLLCQLGQFKSYSPPGRGTCSRPHSLPSSWHIFICIPLWGPLSAGQLQVASNKLAHTLPHTHTYTYMYTLPHTYSSNEYVCKAKHFSSLVVCSFLFGMARLSLPRLSHIFHSFASVGVRSTGYVRGI